MGTLMRGGSILSVMKASALKLESKINPIVNIPKRKNKKLFCRLRTYSKPEFGIAPLDCLDMPVFDEYFTLQPKAYDGSFIPAEPVQDLPEPARTIQNEQPSEYTDSFFHIPKPTNEQKKQVNDNAIITGGSSPSDPVKEELPQMNGFLGGGTGGPPAEITTGKNLSKI